MPIPTPFHSRTSDLCESHEWRDWSGYLSAGTYEIGHEREYYAIRNAAGLIDVSPLYKYDIEGPEALRLLDKVVTRDLSKFSIGQIKYMPWCDSDGKMIDDGTLWRLGPAHFRLTAAHPNLRWLQDCGFGMEATVVDRSQDLAALALQGPNSRKILSRVFPTSDIEKIGYYRLGQDAIPSGYGSSPEVIITRTGYTGDLGYELWVDPAQAELLWDLLFQAGKDYGLLPVGMVALDIARIEAGLLLIDIDYTSSLKAITEARKSTPFEAGLGWAVDLDKGPFVGRRALVQEQVAGPKWGFAGLEIDWLALERLFAAEDLPPMVAGRASRDPAPVYDQSGKQIGQVTSRTFSPILKKYIALATLVKGYDRPGRQVKVEITVEFSREKVPARVVELPFYDPPHRKS